MSRKAANQSRTERQARAREVLREHRRHGLARAGLGVAGLAAVAAGVTVMMLTSQPESSDETRTAPDFALTDSAGEVHRLSDHRGENVVLYFNEGAGCQSCIVQMGEIEKRVDEFAEENVTVLPVVMSTREQIVHDMELNDVKTPFLLDDGEVSAAYGTLGKGMHEGLPGHSFVLIDTEGVQRWYGEYPSMWLDPGDLLDQVRGHLA